MGEEQLPAVQDSQAIASKPLLETMSVIEEIQGQLQSLKEVLDNLLANQETLEVLNLKHYIAGWSALQKGLQWVIDKKLELQAIQRQQIVEQAILEAISSVDFKTAQKIKQAIKEKQEQVGNYL